MPLIGERVKGSLIGKTPCHTYVWQKCESCDKHRWVLVLKGAPLHTRCVACANRSHIPTPYKDCVNWHDNGCHLRPSCLECNRPRCIYG
jgi:hypothetical protein